MDEMDDAMQGPPFWAGLVIADFTLTISLRDSYFHTKATRLDLQDTNGQSRP